MRLRRLLRLVQDRKHLSRKLNFKTPGFPAGTRFFLEEQEW
jgi:hypothetical protein